MQTWWGVSISCPQCKGATVLQFAFFSADGEMKFTFYCPTCKELLHWSIYASVLAHMALRNDLQKDKLTAPAPKLHPGKPVKPPLALPQPTEKLTVADAKWMAEMHIQPPDEGLLK
jgi:hypothetical protein